MKPQLKSSQASASRRYARSAGPCFAAANAFAYVSSLRLVLPVLVSGLIGILMILPPPIGAAANSAKPNAFKVKAADLGRHRLPPGGVDPWFGGHPGATNARKRDGVKLGLEMR